MKLSFDFNYLMSDFLGLEHGISEGEVNSLEDKARDLFISFKESREQGLVPFAELPYQLEPLNKIKQLAQEVRAGYEDYVHLGIGGSALGPMALHRALSHPQHNLLSREKRGGTPRIFFVESVDPDTLSGLKELIDPRKTFFNVVSKSGSTVETASQFSHFCQWLGQFLSRAELRQRLLIITDPTEGPLRKMAQEEGYQTLPLPQGVAGRYSVLTPVGLFPAAVMGFDISGLLEGASFIDQALGKDSFWENPGLMAACLFFLADGKKGKRILIVMPYADGLVGAGQWFRQLWAESLGKSQRGTIPVVSPGTADQHSQLQLYLEGPADKLVFFWAVSRYQTSLSIVTEEGGFKELDYLVGGSFNELFQWERQATELAFRKRWQTESEFFQRQWRTR